MRGYCDLRKAAALGLSSERPFFSAPAQQKGQTGRRDCMYTGMDTVNRLYEALGVEDEWAVRYENGFKWWPAERAQTVEILGEADGPEGERGFYISIRTEDSPVEELDSHFLQWTNVLKMPFASMAGPVYNPRKGVSEFCSWALVYEHISGWMGPLLAMAAALQVFETQEAEPSCDKFTGHPEKGVRKEPSSIVNVIPGVVQPAGESPSRWTGQEFEEAAELANSLPPVILATSGRQGLTAEFPFGNFSSLLQIDGALQHPVYGRGLLQLQYFPVSGKKGEDEKWIKKALELNEPCISPVPAGYGFGSYLYRDGMITHVSFIPNALYVPGLLNNLLLSAMGRAEAMNRELAGERGSGR